MPATGLMDRRENGVSLKVLHNGSWLGSRIPVEWGAVPGLDPGTRPMLV